MALTLANRRKDEFLAMLAHELRNPLAPISTAAELLRLAGADKGGVKQYIGLPDMDGYELSRRLHDMPETRNAAYIALTGYGQAHDKVLAKAAGFGLYFVKPVDMTALQQVLAAAPSDVKAS